MLTRLKMLFSAWPRVSFLDRYYLPDDLTGHLRLCRLNLPLTAYERSELRWHMQSLLTASEAPSPRPKGEHRPPESVASVIIFRHPTLGQGSQNASDAHPYLTPSQKLQYEINTRSDIYCRAELRGKFLRKIPVPWKNFAKSPGIFQEF